MTPATPRTREQVEQELKPLQELQWRFSELHAAIKRFEEFEKDETKTVFIFPSRWGYEKHEPQKIDKEYVLKEMRRGIAQMELEIRQRGGVV